MMNVREFGLSGSTKVTCVLHAEFGSHSKVSQTGQPTPRAGVVSSKPSLLGRSAQAPRANPAATAGARPSSSREPTLSDQLSWLWKSLGRQRPPFYEACGPWRRCTRRPQPQLPRAPQHGARTHVQGRFRGLPRPRHGGPHHACGRAEGQLADWARAHWAQGLPGCWGRVWMVQLGPRGPPKAGGVQPLWPGVVGRVQVTRWCHLRKERRTRSNGPGPPLPGSRPPTLRRH